ncbi:thiosulfate sulfurtransferase [Leptolyngbya sp. 'hensonii']|nr:thiosulfate sulfurtransferase [Leptolyngbya sp. 'hensonii']
MIDAVVVQPSQLVTQWIVSPAEAKYLIEQGAVILDVRDRNSQKNGMLQGAIGISWQQFSQSKFPHQGNLLEDELALTQQLRNVGVFSNKAVVVVGDPLNGWGEDGRIVWMLRTLGHQQTVLVDGGYSALAKTGLPMTRTVSQKAAAVPGDFVIQRVSDWEITQEKLRTGLATTQNLVVIDAREPREFAGATPYGEQRGGHIPGAISLHYKELLDVEGKLLPRGKILALLQDRNIKSDAIIVSYCTGGVRSGWLTSVLVDLGFQAQNYAGSMWEWSAGPANQNFLD